MYIVFFLCSISLNAGKTERDRQLLMSVLPSNLYTGFKYALFRLSGNILILNHMFIMRVNVLDMIFEACCNNFGGMSSESGAEYLRGFKGLFPFLLFEF